MTTQAWPWPKLLGFLALGLVVGAGGVLVFHLTTVISLNYSHKQKLAFFKKNATDLKAKLERLQKIGRASSAVGQAGQVKQPYPKAGWRKHFNKKGQCQLRNQNMKSLRLLLGHPPYVVQTWSGGKTKAIWVYLTSKQDATALYLTFQNGRLVRSLFNEFSGQLSSDSLQ